MKRSKATKCKSATCNSLGDKKWECVLCQYHFHLECEPNIKKISLCTRCDAEYTQVQLIININNNQLFKKRINNKYKTYLFVND